MRSAKILSASLLICFAFLCSAEAKAATAPTFTAGVTASPASVFTKQTETMTVTATASAAASNYTISLNATVNGKTAASKTFSNVTFKANTPVTETYNWAVPSTATPGTYTVTANVTKNSTTYATATTTFSVSVPVVNGACGSSDGTNVTKKPTANLCTTGTTSSVTGSGPWAWSCAGSGGGATASCSANLIVNGSCGTSNGTTVSSAPTANLCKAGTASTVGGSGPWTWSCGGLNGGSTTSCSAKATIPVNGACGTSNGANLTKKPAANLCTTGTSSSVTGSGPWAWSCAGTNGGTAANCSANLIVNGSCGTSNGTTLSSAPTTNLCKAGTASTVDGSGPWTWSCAGLNSGTTASCSAKASLPVNGVCGTSNGTNATKAPTANLCTTGKASTVTGSGPWSWSCAGSNGGTAATCQANLIVNGACGAANGQTLDSAPVANLCNPGTASAISGSGPWTWSCAGLNSGTTASCSANYTNQPSNGVCGSSNGLIVSVAPTANLCTSGTASAVDNSTGPFDWTCTGLNGGTVASCSAMNVTYGAPAIYPGQSGNPVGYAAYAPLGTTPWPGGNFVSGTADNPTVYTGYVFTNPPDISGSYITFISCDFNGGKSGTNITGSNLTFIGSRFQSNSVDNYNVQISGKNIVFQYDTFTPLASQYTSPPGAAWPSAGAGANSTTQTAGVNTIPYAAAYQYGISVDSGGPVTVDHSDFWGFGNDAIQWMNTNTQMIVTNNWMHDNANQGTAPNDYHQDGLGYVNDTAGPNNILIQNNTVASLGNTNAIAFQGGTSGFNNIQIIGNYVSGYGYTVYLAQFTNSTFADNVFGTDVANIWGPNADWVTGKGNVWKCNTINVVPGTTWTDGGDGLGPWKPGAADNGLFWIPTSSIDSAVDYVGNTSCP